MEFRRVLFRSASREAFVILSNMGNTSALPSPRRAGAVSGRPRRRGPWSAIPPAQPPERGELPEPLERREPVEPAMRARGVVELVEPTMALLEFGEAPTPSNAVELLAINPVTSLDLPVQVRAPRPDAAMVNRRRLAGGDIGTSPLYARKETFAGHHPLAVTEANVFAVLALLFWTVMVLVTLKYVAVIMRADNRGEGGSLALLALVTELTKDNPLLRWGAAMLGIFAAALFFGDSMITPAISVLSAVEGLEVVNPDLHEYIIPISAGVLTILFFVQNRGTGVVGLAFGPIMVAWFATLAVQGALAIAHQPRSEEHTSEL